jgi:polyisoprenoid-binding protein YceI
MFRRIVLASLVITALFAVEAHAAPAAYEINANHTQILYSYSHFGYSHITGRLTGVAGTFHFDPAAPAHSDISVSIPIASISTGVPDLDKELQGAAFFAADKFPDATFKSTSVKSTGKDKLAVSGDLTIHGVTRPITLDVTINKIGVHPMGGRAAAGFDATTSLKRSDFGVSNYVPKVSDEVQIHITMEAIEAKKP